MTRAEFETEQRARFARTGRLFGRFECLGLPGDNAVSRWICSDGIWEAWVSAAFVNLVASRPCRHFLDVGAHIGYYTLLASSLGVERITALEPNPDAYDVLKANVERNGIPCRAVWAAAADGNGIGELCVNAVNPGGSSLHLGPASARLVGLQDRVIVVPVRSVDSMGLEPDVVKIDAEGAEVEILDGAAETIRRCRPAILAEFAPGRGYDPAAVVRAFCRQHEYVAGVIDHGGGLVGMPDSFSDLFNVVLRPSR